MYIYIYNTYIDICAVESISVQRFGFLIHYLVQDFCLISQIVMFLGMFQSQMVCRGAKIAFFLKIARMPKWGFHKESCILFLPLCWRKKNRKEEKKKGTPQQCPENVCFGGWVGKILIFLWLLFKEIAKHYLCLEGEKRKDIFVNTIRFGKIVPFRFL